MTESGLPDPGTPFGQRVRRRLREEQIIWITTVGNDCTPQPNPVGFVFQQDESILIYSALEANRNAHLLNRPRVALNFDGDGSGGDIMVFTGTARRVDDIPPAHENPGYLTKYAEAAAQAFGSVENFSRQFPVPLRVDITRTRGR